MRIFAVKDACDSLGTDAAWLIYYEKAKCFYTELPDAADPWHIPLIFSAFASRGKKNVNAYWSKIWVQQRIVPPERQNIGQILKDNGLDAYDEFQLLCLSDGRCAQDDYYIAEISEAELPESIRARFAQKTADVIPLSGHAVLVFFAGGETKRCSLADIFASDRIYAPLLKDSAFFNEVSVQPGGYGICWGEQAAISYDELYRIGTPVPLKQEDLDSFVQNRVVTSAQAAALLHCSKQNIEDLTRRGKLHPILAAPKSRLYRKSEVMQRLTE